MTRQLSEIPELAAMRDGGRVLRIPPGVDVPLTRRIERVIDTPAFRRLASVSQLGLVSMVYPGATHTRFEHSLGAYRMAVLYLQRLARDERFVEVVDYELAEQFLLAALLHDVGHWPYCHAIEDIGLNDLPEHETLARATLCQGELAVAIADAWGIEGRRIANMLAGEATTPGERLIKSMLSSPIDIDKVDYLQRDSLHAGVPYGNHFDQGRLISSLCVNASGDGLALSEKGKTAAELLVFARYVMFSEVYWHHTVRSATAMLQRLVWEYVQRQPVEPLTRTNDRNFAETMSSPHAGGVELLLGHSLWGESRRLYKRLSQYSLAESPEVYRALAQKPYAWLVECSNLLATALGLQPGEVLVDAPPVSLEVQFRVDLYYQKLDEYKRLGDVSPVVRALAREQFDDFVKRVRVFVVPEAREAIKLSPTELNDLIAQVSQSLD